MIPLTPAEIATATRGSLAGVDDGDARGIVGVSVDSRAVENGDLFVAIAGERVDGHDYAAEAVAAGARCILSARPLRPRAPALPGSLAFSKRPPRTLCGSAPRAPRVRAASARESCAL